MTRKAPAEPLSNIVDDARLLRALNKVLTDHGIKIAGTVSAGDAVYLLAQRQERIGFTPKTTGPAVQPGQDGTALPPPNPGKTTPPI